MMRAVACVAAAAAMRYFGGGGGLAQGDYYVEGTEQPGHWEGLGAALLGLSGVVEKDAFARLCHNRHPFNGAPLTIRTKAFRRVGYDFNFHCPKSVSLLHALTGDQEILQAFEDAVSQTMVHIEREAKARVRLAGAQTDRLTANLAWARFVHFTSRPVDGIPDPHLHAHCFIFNATFDPVEGRWKAVQFGDIKRDAGYFEACFHSLLAGRLRVLGYSIARRGRFFEVAGLSEGLLHKFSRRTDQVERVAKALGVFDPKQKAELGARTRAGKKDGLPLEAVREAWYERLTLDDLRALWGAKHKEGTATGSLRAEAAVERALRIALERRSVLPERELVEGALRQSLGLASVDEILLAVRASPLLRRDLAGRPHVTTEAVLCEEQAVLAFAQGGRGRCASLLSVLPDLTESGLSEDQARVVRHIWSSPDRVILVRGPAGTGKTTLMRAAIAGLEAAGQRVAVFAPTTDASRGVLRHEGFGLAETVARLLADHTLQEGLRGQVLWIDEAGLLSVRTTKQLFDLAEALGCRIILAGDTCQHRAVERGDALRLLEAYGGLPVAALSEIRRQRGAYKEAIQALAARDLEGGFAKLCRLGAVREAEPEVAHQVIADEYLRARDERKTALVVSPTHAEGACVTAAIRARLRSAGLLGEERVFTRLQCLGLTAGERSDVAHYRAGLVVQFQRPVPRLRAGARVEVVEATADEVWISSSDNRASLPLRHAARFEVFQPVPIALATGDVVRITRNGRTKDGKHALHNGALYTVAGFTATGDIELENGWLVGRDFGHLTHGYCLTSYAAQGKTVDRVFIAQSADSFGASSMEQFYVSASRARERVVIFTEDREELKAAVRRSSERPAAVEFIEEEVARERLRGVSIAARVKESPRFCELVP